MRGTDMRQTIGLMAACAALLASCTNEEMNEGLGIDTPIQVTASVEGALTTRTDNSTESLSTFGLTTRGRISLPRAKMGHGHSIRPSYTKAVGRATTPTRPIRRGIRARA